MKNPVAIGIMVALAVGLVYFAFRAGQNNPKGTVSQAAQSELEKLRGEYDTLRAKYDGDLKELRDDFTEQVRELERSIYGLREQMARAGVDVKPMGGPQSSSPGARPGAASAPAGPIAKEAFYQLRSNMSVQDVERVLGRPGELNYRMGENDGTSTENYRWLWINSDGSEGRVTVTFRNNKLQDKEFWGDEDED